MADNMCLVSEFNQWQNNRNYISGAPRKGSEGLMLMTCRCENLCQKQKQKKAEWGHV